ncbi:MAG: hypothetical protein HC794_10250 [Nitrospiraceae bacterium]|nr:hypothetical protein [Nitrospiraceae bacterium]
MRQMTNAFRPVSLGLGMLMASTAQAGTLGCKSTADDPALAPISQPKFSNVLNGSLYLQIDSDGESSGVPTCIDKDGMLTGKYVPDNWQLAERNMFFGFTDGQVSYRVELRGESFAGNQTRDVSIQGQTWPRQVGGEQLYYRADIQRNRKKTDCSRCNDRIAQA